MSKATKAIETPAIEEQPGTSVLTVPLTDEDYAAMEAMMQATGASAVNVTRLALWHYALHLDLNLPPRVFGVRRRPHAGHPVT